MQLDPAELRKAAGWTPPWPMSVGRSLKLPPEKSVRKPKAGDVVKLSEAEFVRPSKAEYQ